MVTEGVCGQQEMECGERPRVAGPAMVCCRAACSFAVSLVAAAGYQCRSQMMPQKLVWQLTVSRLCCLVHAC